MGGWVPWECECTWTSRAALGSGWARGPDWGAGSGRPADPGVAATRRVPAGRALQVDATAVFSQDDLDPVNVSVLEAGSTVSSPPPLLPYPPRPQPLHTHRSAASNVRSAQLRRQSGSGAASRRLLDAGASRFPGVGRRARAPGPPPLMRLCLRARLALHVRAQLSVWAGRETSPSERVRAHSLLQAYVALKGGKVRGRRSG